jgi:hypothetical protein
MSPRLLRPVASGRFLLDQFGGAAAAYSLRRLRSGYTGAAVRVRRSNDNAEANFTPEEVASGALATWTGANNGFVVTWFDQSENGRNVSQSSVTLQPQIVTSGVVETLNGKPAINWDTANVNKVLTGTISTGTAISCVAAFSSASRPAHYQKIFNLGNDSETSGYALTPFTWQGFSDWQAGDFLFLGDGYGATRSSRIVTAVNPIVSSRTAQTIISGYISSQTARLFVNRSEVASYRKQSTGNTSVLTNAPLYIGNHNASVQQLNGMLQEVVIWPQDLIASRTQIESNLSPYYGV